MCDGCGWEDYVEKMEEMKEDSDFDFAKETITGISGWVSDNGHITDRQINAINNIYNSKR